MYQSAENHAFGSWKEKYWPYNSPFHKKKSLYMDKINEKYHITYFFIKVPFGWRKYRQDGLVCQ